MGLLFIIIAELINSISGKSFAVLIFLSFLPMIISFIQYFILTREKKLAILK